MTHDGYGIRAMNSQQLRQRYAEFDGEVRAAIDEQLALLETEEPYGSVAALDHGPLTSLAFSQRFS